MKKAYSHFAALALAAMAFSSCSRTDYATHQAASPLTEASVAQAPATISPAAEMSAQVVAHPLPAEAIAPTAPAPATAVVPAAVPTPRRAATPALTATTEAAVVAKAEVAPAKTAKPTLVQRLMLQKVAKQLTKAEARHQNTASTEQTAAHSGSLTILLVGLVVLLVGILVSSGFLVTVGSIIAVVGLILLLLKAL